MSRISTDGDDSDSWLPLRSPPEPSSFDRTSSAMTSLDLSAFSGWQSARGRQCASSTGGSFTDWMVESLAGTRAVSPPPSLRELHPDDPLLIPSTRATRYEKLGPRRNRKRASRRRSKSLQPNRSAYSRVRSSRRADGDELEYLARSYQTFNDSKSIEQDSLAEILDGPRVNMIQVPTPHPFERGAITIKASEHSTRPPHRTRVQVTSPVLGRGIHEVGDYSVASDSTDSPEQPCQQPHHVGSRVPEQGLRQVGTYDVTVETEPPELPSQQIHDIASQKSIRQQVPETGHQVSERHVSEKGRHQIHEFPDVGLGLLESHAPEQCRHEAREAPEFGQEVRAPEHGCNKVHISPDLGLEVRECHVPGQDQFGGYGLNVRECHVPEQGRYPVRESHEFGHKIGNTLEPGQGCHQVHESLEFGPEHFGNSVPEQDLHNHVQEQSRHLGNGQSEFGLEPHECRDPEQDSHFAPFSPAFGVELHPSRPPEQGRHKVRECSELRHDKSRVKEEGRHKVPESPELRLQLHEISVAEQVRHQVHESLELGRRQVREWRKQTFRSDTPQEKREPAPALSAEATSFVGQQNSKADSLLSVSELPQQQLEALQESIYVDFSAHESKTPVESDMPTVLSAVPSHSVDDVAAECAANINSAALRKSPVCSPAITDQAQEGHKAAANRRYTSLQHHQSEREIWELQRQLEASRMELSSAQAAWQAATAERSQAEESASSQTFRERIRTENLLRQEMNKTQQLQEEAEGLRCQVAQMKRQMKRQMDQLRLSTSATKIIAAAATGAVAKPITGAVAKPITERSQIASSLRSMDSLADTLSIASHYNSPPPSTIVNSNTCAKTAARMQKENYARSRVTVVPRSSESLVSVPNSHTGISPSQPPPSAKDVVPPSMESFVGALSIPTPHTSPHQRPLSAKELLPRSMESEVDLLSVPNSHTIPISASQQPRSANSTHNHTDPFSAKPVVQLEKNGLVRSRPEAASRMGSAQAVPGLNSRTSPLPVPRLPNTSSTSNSEEWFGAMLIAEQQKNATVRARSGVGSRSTESLKCGSLDASPASKESNVVELDLQPKNNASRLEVSRRWMEPLACGPSIPRSAVQSQKNTPVQSHTEDGLHTPSSHNTNPSPAALSRSESGEGIRKKSFGANPDSVKKSTVQPLTEALPQPACISKDSSSANPDQRPAKKNTVRSRTEAVPQSTCVSKKPSVASKDAYPAKSSVRSHSEAVPRPMEPPVSTPAVPNRPKTSPPQAPSASSTCSSKESIPKPPVPRVITTCSNKEEPRPQSEISALKAILAAARSALADSSRSFPSSSSRATTKEEPSTDIDEEESSQVRQWRLEAQTTRMNNDIRAESLRQKLRTVQLKKKRLQESTGAGEGTGEVDEQQPHTRIKEEKFTLPAQLSPRHWTRDWHNGVRAALIRELIPEMDYSCDAASADGSADGSENTENTEETGILEEFQRAIGNISEDKGTNYFSDVSIPGLTCYGRG